MKRAWYDLTAQGVKTEDYRAITPYWIKRLTFNHRPITLEELLEMKGPIGDQVSVLDMTAKRFDSVIEHIYGHVEPIEYEFKGITIGEGKPEWGAERGVKYFVIALGKKVN